MSSLQPRNEELLSAYIDGELSEAERAEVEAWLAEDPQARALVDELRGLSSAVKSLPPEKLSRDLAPAVLDELARHAPSRGAAANSLPPANPSLLSRRGIWWSAAAIAAALLIAFLGPQQINEPQGPIAQQEKKAASAQQGGRVATGGEAPQLSAPDDDVAAPAADGRFVRSGGRSAEQFFEPRGATDHVPPPPMAPQATDLIRSAPGLAGGQGAATPRTMEATIAAPPSDNQPTDAGDYLVVWVDVPADAADDRAIEKLFVRNDIQVESQVHQWSAADEPVREHLAKRVADRSAFGVDGQDPGEAGERDQLPREGATSRSFASPQAAAVRSALSEAILVEATWDQLSRCLADMQEDTQNFQEITVEAVVDPPAPSSERSSHQGQEGQGEEAQPQGTTLQAEQSEAPRPPAAEPPGDEVPPVADQASSDASPPAAPAPTSTASAPAPESGPTGETPPPEPAPEPMAQEGAEYDYAAGGEQRGAPREGTRAGRARRLPPIVTSPQEPSGPNTVNLSPGDRGQGQSPPSQELQFDRLDTAARTQRLLKEQLNQRSATSGQGGDRPLQVLFVLRSKPPEIAAEAAPARAAPADQ